MSKVRPQHIGSWVCLFFSVDLNWLSGSIANPFGFAIRSLGPVYLNGYTYNKLTVVYTYIIMDGSLEMSVLVYFGSVVWPCVHFGHLPQTTVVLFLEKKKSNYISGELVSITTTTTTTGQTVLTCWIVNWPRRAGDRFFSLFIFIFFFFCILDTQREGERD